MKKLLLLAMVIGLLVSGCATMSDHQKRWSGGIDPTSIKDQKVFNKDHLECSVIAHLQSKSSISPGLFLIIPYGGLIAIPVAIIQGNAEERAWDSSYSNCMMSREYKVNLPKPKSTEEQLPSRGVEITGGSGKVEEKKTEKETIKLKEPIEKKVKEKKIADEKPKAIKEEALFVTVEGAIYYHRENCAEFYRRVGMSMGRIIRFSRGEAGKMGLKPCPSCKP